MKKIIITALVISILALAFFACDSSTTAGYTSEPPYSVPDSSEPYEPTDTDENGNGNNGGGDVIGQLVPYEPFTTPSIGVPRPFLGNATYRYVTQQYVNTHPNSPRFVYNDEGNWMSFAFDMHMRDVMFVRINPIELDDDGDIQNYEVTEIIHRVGTLNVNHPVFIQTIGHYGTMPAQAIGFVMPDGTRYFVPFDQSQMDGSLSFHYWAAFTPR